MLVAVFGCVLVRVFDCVLRNAHHQPPCCTPLRPISKSQTGRPGDLRARSILQDRNRGPGGRGSWRPPIRGARAALGQLFGDAVSMMVEDERNRATTVASGSAVCSVTSRSRIKSRNASDDWYSAPLNRASNLFRSSESSAIPILLRTPYALPPSRSTSSFSWEVSE